MSAILALQVVALIFLFLAALPLPFASPVQLGWLGLFFWLLSRIIGH